MISKILRNKLQCFGNWTTICDILVLVFDSGVRLLSMCLWGLVTIYYFPNSGAGVWLSFLCLSDISDRRTLEICLIHFFFWLLLLELIWHGILYFCYFYMLMDEMILVFRLNILSLG